MDRQVITFIFLPFASQDETEAHNIYCDVCEYLETDIFDIPVIMEQEEFKPRKKK